MSYSGIVEKGDLIDLVLKTHPGKSKAELDGILAAQNSSVSSSSSSSNSTTNNPLANMDAETLKNQGKSNSPELPPYSRFETSSRSPTHSKMRFI